MLRAAFLLVALEALALPGSAAAACRPTPAHPYPVILVHGTFGSTALSWGRARRRAAVRAFSLPAGRAARLTVQLGPRARRASAVSISAPHALTRPYALRSS